MFNFGRKIRRVARRQWRHGKLDRKTYQKIIDGSRDPDMVAKWKAAVENEISGAPWLQKTGIDGGMLAAIWAWCIENWATILRILLSLLIFVEPSPQSKGKNIRHTHSRKVTAPNKGDYLSFNK